MLRVTWVFLLAAALAGCSGSGGNSVPPPVSAPTATPTATPVPTPTPTPTVKPTATPTPKPTPTPTPTTKPTATPVPSPTPTLTMGSGSLNFPAAKGFPYSLVVTYGPNDAPAGQVAVGCAVNSTTEIGTGSGQCPTGGAPNASGAIIWIAVTFVPSGTGSVFFGGAPPPSTVAGLPSGTYSYVAYRGAIQVGSGPLTAGSTYSYASPFTETTVPDNTITTIEIIKD